MTSNLGLDEAIVIVRRLQKSPLPLDVFHQIDECFGCPLEKIISLRLEDQEENFVIGTKYKQSLELRQVDSNYSCNLGVLNLNNHGHYKIDVSSSNNSLDCSVQTLSKGDCYLCPVAVLVCILAGIMIIERVYERFSPTKSGRVRRKLEDMRSSTSSTQRRQSQLSDGNGTPEELGANRRASNDDTKPITQVNLRDDSLQQSDVQHQAESLSENPESQRTRTSGARVESLDVFRGLTIAGMIIVNYGGAGYTFLEHKPWDGITLADFVFPFFIFSMGASIAISTKSLAKRGLTIGPMTKKILRRSLILMALGLCLNSKWLNDRSLSYLRLTGVLQRFSISYLVVAMMYAIELLLENWFKTQSLSRVRLLPNILCVLFEILTALNYTAIYIYVTFYLEYSPTCPPGYTGPGGQTEGGRYANCTGGAAAWLDHLLLGNDHLYQDHEVMSIFKATVSHDPEGILGYSTSILLTLAGLQCGKALVNYKTHKSRLLGMVQWLVLLSGASLSAITIPINKRLWSFSFVTVTGASAYLIMILLYLLVDQYKCRKSLILRLLSSAGKNAIFLYVGHSLLAGMLPWHFAVNNNSHLQLLLRLAWATFVWLLIAHHMALKNLFIKI